MIKENELRMGNWLRFTKGGLNGTVLIIDGFVNHITLEMPEVDYERFDCELSELNPIPLTAEWLEKFGFEKETKYFDDFRAKIRLDFRNPYYAARIKRNNSWSYFSNLFYVHQLQNLFFSLSGSELTIKETVK